MGELRRESIDPADLVRVEPPGRPVVLKSGGPVMDLESWSDDGQALCRWAAADGRVCRAVLPAACLYRCEPLAVSE